MSSQQSDQFSQSHLVFT